MNLDQTNWHGNCFAVWRT